VILILFLLRLASVAFVLACMVGICWLLCLVFYWVRTNGGPHA
jgi:hypothetical protein